MMAPRTMIVGDVHGMLQELEALMVKLAPTTEDTVVFVGDLVDKGPDSPGVVGFVRELADRVPVVLVEGNHEDKHRQFRRNKTVHPDVAANMASRSPELASITDGMSDADVAFLDTAVPFHRVPEHNLLVVHGGGPGDMTDFPATVKKPLD